MSERIYGEIPIHARSPDREPLSDRIREDLASELSDLIRLEHAVADSYQAALFRFEDADLAVCVRQLAERARPIHLLEDRVRDLGEVPPERADYHRLLGRGRLAVAGLRGGEAVLAALRANEEKLRKAYRAAIELSGFLDEEREAIGRGLAATESRLLALVKLS